MSLCTSLQVSAIVCTRVCTTRVSLVAIFCLGLYAALLCLFSFFPLCVGVYVCVCSCVVCVTCSFCIFFALRCRCVCVSIASCCSSCNCAALQHCRLLSACFSASCVCLCARARLKGARVAAGDGARPRGIRARAGRRRSVLHCECCVPPPPPPV